jgi:hypothetical protein
VLLMITAAILTAMLLPAIMNDEDSAAYGDASVRQGKYIMVTGAYDISIDLLYVLNIETQKLCVYAPNSKTRMIDKMGNAIPLQSGTATGKY